MIDLDRAESIFWLLAFLFISLPRIIKYIIKPYKEDWHKDFFNYQ